MVKEIPLSKGVIALVDDEDYERVNKYKWHAQKGKYTWYAVHDFRTTKPRVVITMHRYILGLDGDYTCDHANGNGCDNRRCNMRKGTVADNNRNKRKFKPKSSQYKGVCFFKRDQNWIAAIMVN
ncbi:MAG: hypothetical protein PHQ43_15890, partial [Dehalococcoidales bacterium]|nr:hypothetical protein [Dehalococcoidales bacterium]